MTEKYQKIIDENENSNYGGFFPIGECNTWHSGIHLYGEKINPLVDGHIVAYRQNKVLVEVLRKEEISDDEYKKLKDEEKEFYKAILPEDNKQKAAAEIKELIDKNLKEKLSGNFYIIRHSLLGDKFVFYSLYTHMNPDDLELSELNNYKKLSNDIIKKQLPVTKKFKYKFNGNKENAADLHIIGSDKKVFPGSWFEIDCDYKISEFLEGKAKGSLSFYGKFDTENEPQTITLEMSELLYADIEYENADLYPKVGDILYSANANPLVVGKIPNHKVNLPVNDVNNDALVNLFGKEFTQNTDYLHTNLLLPKEYLGTILYDESNIYSLREETDKIYRISSNKKTADFNENNVPLKFEEYDYIKCTNKDKRILNDKVIILRVSELQELLKADKNNYAFIRNYSSGNKSLIIELEDFKEFEERVKKNIDTQWVEFNPKKNLYEIKNEKVKKNHYITAQESESYAFVYLPNFNEENTNDIKFFIEGKAFNPITLPRICKSRLLEFVEKYKKGKISNPAYLNMANITVLFVEPVNVYKGDAFKENLSNRNYLYEKIKEHNGYIICNPYIQNKCNREYVIKQDSGKIVKLRGRIKNNIITATDDNLVLYNNLNESKEFGSKNPLDVKSGELEFFCKALPTLKGNNYVFTGIDIGNSQSYSAIINKEKLQVKMDDSDKGIKTDEAIHFCDIPVYENELLGFPLSDNKYKDDKKYFDVSLFLEKEFKDIKLSADMKYYIYGNIKKGKKLYENYSVPEKIFFPKGTTFSFIEKFDNSNKTAFKLKAKKIPVFFLRKDVEQIESKTRYYFKSKPTTVYLDDYSVSNAHLDSQYCNIPFSGEKIYKKYKNSTLDFIGNDRVNPKQYNSYYFTADDLEFRQEVWINAEQLKDKISTPITKDSDFEITANVEGLRYYTDNFLLDTSKNTTFGKLYIPVKSVLKCKEIYESENGIAYKIQLIKIPITINNKFINEVLVYKLKEAADLQNISLNNEVITKDSKGENEKFANSFFKTESQTSLKNSELDFYEVGKTNSYIGLYVLADIISMDFNFWCKEDALGNVDNWEEKEFEIKKDNNISKDITLTCYPDNPLILHKKDYEINEDTKITNIDDTEEVQDESKNKYYKIELKDNPTILYIPVKDADNYRKNALDWDKFFNICKTDADKDIYCNLEDIKDALKLTEAEKEGIGNLSCIKMQDLLAKDTEAKKAIAEKLRRLNVTHIHELDSKAYDGIEDDIDKKYLQGCCEKIGVWEKLKSADGFPESKLKNVKCMDNLLSFVHPAYFLNHLDKAGIFEFNPYKGFSYSDVYNTGNGYCNGIDMDTKIRDNPGFAPIWDSRKGGVKKNNFAGTNGFYNQDYSDLPDYQKYEYMYHEGVDFSGFWVEGQKGTEIKALINCEVLAWGWYGGYGKTIFFKNSDGIGLYLLGHLSEYPENITKNKKYFRNQVVGYVGASGHGKVNYWKGPHLHLSYYHYLVNKKIMEGTGKNINILKDEFHAKLRNPFIHNSKPWNGKGPLKK